MHVLYFLQDIIYKLHIIYIIYINYEMSTYIIHYIIIIGYIFFIFIIYNVIYIIDSICMYRFILYINLLLLLFISLQDTNVMKVIKV